MLESASDLKVISRHDVGVDNIDLTRANELGISVRGTPGANAQGVAELVIGLIFALVRSIPFGDSAIKQSRWERRIGVELNGRTLGLVGCGRIGKQVARLALGLGLEVVAFDPCADYSFIPSDRFRYHPLHDVLRRADIISVHCPLQANGCPVIDSEAISLMKKGSYLVNTARAGLVEQKTVLDALESGHLAGAAIDVFAQEPPVDDKLAGHTRVVATPHIGGYTQESVSRAVQAAVENLLDELGGCGVKS